MAVSAHSRVVPVPESLTREQCVFMAKLAEQAQRYEEMVRFMVKLVHSVTPESELTVLERNLLSVAYKNVVGSLRASWRVMSSIEQKEEEEEARRSDDRIALIRDYRSGVEAEIAAVCNAVLRLLDSNLVPSTSAAESKVFYLKMKGDYHRYLAEIKLDGERKAEATETMIAYTAGQELAAAELPSTHPIRLGLALNFSVFYYEILNHAEKACSLAKQSFKEAIDELESLGDGPYKASSMIMQLLRDNFTLWNTDVQNQKFENFI